MCGGGACHGTSVKVREELCWLALSFCLCMGSSAQTQATTLYPLSHIASPQIFLSWRGWKNIYLKLSIFLLRSWFIKKKKKKKATFSCIFVPTESLSRDQGGWAQALPTRCCDVTGGCQSLSSAAMGFPFSDGAAHTGPARCCDVTGSHRSLERVRLLCASGSQGETGHAGPAPHVLFQPRALS